MRWACLGLAAWAAALAGATQPQPHNVMDLLNERPELSTFVRLLQRTRLIPSLSRMQELDVEGHGMTLFAPTNAAFEEASKSMEWLGFLFNDTALPDNVHAKLRQHLWYHILNYSLPLDHAGTVQLQETMYRPSRRRLHEPTRPGTVPQKPKQPPHPGAEDEGGLLSGQGQLVRVTFGANGTVTQVGTDNHGKGGAKVLSINETSSRGTLYVVDSVLTMPPSLATFLQNQNASELFQLWTSELLEALDTSAHVTLFLPTANAWSKLGPLEREYLYGPSPQALDDRLKLFGWHTSSQGLGQGAVAYASTLKQAQSTTLTTILGGDVNITTSDGGTLMMNNIPVVEEDILLENGVVHMINGVYMPFGDLGMSIEKYLLALRADKFVALLHTAGLDDFITQDPHERPRLGAHSGPYTFLVPPNDVLDSWWGGVPVAQKITSQSPVAEMQRLREMLLYHIVQGHVTAPSNGTLLPTELFPAGLLGAPQRVPVYANDLPRAFGRANVVRERTEAANSSIFLVDNVVRVPTDPVYTSAYISLNTYEQALSKAHCSGVFRRMPQRTYLGPTDSAFESTGLVAKYLLHGHTDDLAAVLDYHALPGVWYSSDVPTSWTPVTSVHGDDVELCRDKRGIYVRTNATGPMRVSQADVLTDTGVLHTVDRLSLPSSVTISLEKLAHGSPTRRMMAILAQAGFDWVWRDKLPLEARGRCGRQRLVLLLPNDAAFARINLTEYERNPAMLRALAALHILLVDDCEPVKRQSLDLPLTLADEGHYYSLLDRHQGGSSTYGALALRYTGHDSKNPLGYMIGVKGARTKEGQQHAARVIDFGRTNLPTQSGSVIAGGILTIDTVLEPYEPGWLDRWTWLWQLVLVLLLVLGIVFTYHLRAWRQEYTRLRSEPLDGEEQ